MKVNFLLGIIAITFILIQLVTTSCKKETNALAEVETSAAIVFNIDTVKVIARVVNDNGTPVSERGICWSTSDNPSLHDNKIIEGGGTGNFECDITGISPETVYHVRAFATNQGGTAYGNIIVFSVSSDIPEVETLGYTPIDAYTVKVFARVVSDNNKPVTERGVVWSQSENPTIGDNKLIEGEGTGLFECSITDLIPLTEYHARAFATNESGTSYGAEIIFMTYMPLALSEVETNSVNPTGPTSATVAANVITDNNTPVTERGVVWNLTGNPTLNNNKIVEGAGTGMYSCEITGLYPNTKYHVRAYAKNQAGTSYGNDLLFETPTSIIATILDQPIILRTIDSVRSFPDNWPECADDTYAYPDALTLSKLIDVNNDSINDYNFKLTHDNRICNPNSHCSDNNSYILYMDIKGTTLNHIFINKDSGNTRFFTFSDIIEYDISNTNTIHGALLIGACDGDYAESIDDKYVGIVYNNMLGWIHIDLQNNYELVIRGWAINTIPFAPIRAGQTE